MKNSTLAITISTVPNLENAKKIASALVEEKLAACVNIIPGLNSVYHWENKLEISDELLLIIKSPARLSKELETRLSELHPYEIPEIVGFHANKVAESYHKWVEESVKNNNH